MHPQPSPIGIRRSRRAQQTQGYQNSLHHIAIPRISIGCVSTHTQTA
jgi:hypothetical protein